MNCANGSVAWRRAFARNTRIRFMMEHQEITRTLPHRYPIILVDRVMEVEANKRIVALKNVSINEPVFAGHFPGYPVMPGVLILEALAQAAAILSIVTLGDQRPKDLIY